MSEERIDIVLRIKDEGTGTVKEVTGSLKNLDKEAQGTTSRGLTSLQKMLSVGIVAAVGAATVALGGLGTAIGSSIGKAAAMEQGVADIAATMQLTAVETAQVKDLISNLGLDPKLKVSATEAAQAIGVLGTAGFEVNEIVGGMARNTVLLANSTAASFDQAGAIVSDVAAQFDIDAAGMADAVNQITGVTVASKFSINDYSDAIAQSGGVASSVGLDFEDFNAIIAGTAFNFKGGSDAGTSLKTFLTSLIPNSNAAADAMRDLGLYTGLTGKEFDDTTGKINKIKERIEELDPTSKNYAEKLSKLRAEQAELTATLVEGGSAFFDANGMMRSAEEIQAALIHSTKGLSEAKLNDAFATIFGQDASRTAFALIKEGVPTIEEMKGIIGDTSAEESAAIRMDTFAGAVEIAQGVIDTISMSIGDKFLPVLRPLIERFTELAQVYGPIVIDFFGDVADKLNTLIQTIFPAPTEVEKVASAFSSFGVTAQGVVDTMALLSVSITGTGEATETTGKSFFAFLDPIKAILAPVISLITEFVSWKDALLGTAIALTATFWPAISAAIGGAIGVIGSFIAAATPIVAPILAAIAAVATLRTAWENNWGDIRTVITAAWDVISGVFTSVTTEVSQVVETFRGKWAELTASNATLGEKLILVWDGIKEAAAVAWGAIVTSVQELWPKFAETVTAWGTAAWDWIQKSIPIALEEIKEWGNALIGWLGKNLPTWIATLLEWGASLYRWIGDALPGAIDALTNFIRGVREKGDQEGGGSFGSMVSQWASTLWRWIQNDLIPKVGPAFSDFIRSMLTYGQKLVVSLGNLAKELGLLLWDWIVDVTPVALKKLGEWGSELWGWIKEKAPVWKDHLLEWAGLAWSWITKVAIPTALEKLGEWGTALWDWVKDNAPTWAEKLGEWAKAAWEWITKTAIPEALTKLGEWGQALIDWVKENAPIWAEQFKDAGLKMMLWLRDSIEIGWIRLTDWFFSDTAFGGFVGDILQTFGIQIGPAYGTFYEHGKKIVYSLNDGSRHGLNDLRQTGSDMGNALSGGLQTSMDMHSPSRVMWGFGEDITASLAGGIRSGVGALKSEMQYVGEQIQAAMKLSNDKIRQEVESLTNSLTAQMARLKGAMVQSTADLSKYAVDASQIIGYVGNTAILAGVNKLPNGGKGTATTGSLPLAAFPQAQEMLDAVNDWQATFLKTKDPLNDYLATVKDLIALAPQDIQNAFGRWMDNWKADDEPLNDMLVGLKEALMARLKGSNIANFVPEVKEITTLGDALGVIKDMAPAIKETATLLGGVSLMVEDLDPEGTRNKNIIGQTVNNTLSALGTFFNSRDVVATLKAQDESTQSALMGMFERLGGMMKSAGTAAGLATDAKSFQDIMTNLSTGVMNIFGQGASSSLFHGNEGMQSWLSSVTLEIQNYLTRTMTAGLDALKVKDPVADFVAGLGDFLSETLEGAGGVFNNFKLQEEKAYREGNLTEFIASEAGKTKNDLKGLYQGIKNSVADLLGISTSELNVTGADSLRLIDRMEQVLNGTTIDSNMDFIGKLLQDLVNFRNLSNAATSKPYYDSALPTDARLTGGKGGDTYNYTIQLMGTSNPSADLMSTVQLLQQLGTA